MRIAFVNFRIFQKSQFSNDIDETIDSVSNRRYRRLLSTNEKNNDNYVDSQSDEDAESNANQEEEGKSESENEVCNEKK